jgi:HEAT repeat protein
MRALAVLGLGIARDKAVTAEVAAIARSVDAGNVARAAAAYALGDLDAQGEVPTLLEIAEDGDALPRRMALVALARMAGIGGKEPAWKNEVVQAMADAVFAGGDDGPGGRASAQALTATAVAALATMADSARASSRTRETIPIPEGSLEIDALLDVLVSRDAPQAAAMAATLLRFADPIQRAALAALRTSGSRARAVLDALGSGQGELLPFVPRGASGPAAEKARAIAGALEPSVVSLARHPDPEVRTKAIVLVARSSSDAATEAVVAALEDSNESVQRVALAAVAAPRDGRNQGDGGRVPATGRAAAAVGKVLANHESWAMRVLAAQALGRLGAAGAADASARLAEAALHDTYALVREAALEALASFDPSARSTAQRMVASDPEPRVREAARAVVISSPR